MIRRFARMRDVAKATKLSRSALYKHLGAGELEAIKLRGRTMIALDSIDRLLENAPPRLAANAQKIRDALVRDSVAVEVAFDGTEWLKRWITLGGIVQTEREIAVTLPLADGEGTTATLARAAHLRIGLTAEDRIEAIRKAAEELLGSEQKPDR